MALRLRLRKGISSVALFWDLDNKPPNSVPPYNAALRLRSLARQFGVVSSMIAYANRHAFSYVPPRVRAERHQRKALDTLETLGLFQPSHPYVCGVCGRKFNAHVKFQKHFRELHEREQGKRLRRLESTKGKAKKLLLEKLRPKMEKYRSVAKDVLVPKVGYGLAQELQKAGFLVRTVSDKPEAADIALEKSMMDAIAGGIECLCLVSDDSDFVGVLKEARERSLRTVVVGDNDQGLKRFADTGFSWREIMNQSSFPEGLWKNRDVTKQLGCAKGRKNDYEFDDEDFELEEFAEAGESEQFEGDGKGYYAGGVSEESDYELCEEEGSDEESEWKAEEELESLKNARPWWKLPSEEDGIVASPSCRRCAQKSK